MSLYSWNVIATVAEHHSISQAANILNLTPSAVSHMVKKVEDGVGYALFIRERNHFELTSSGKALLPYIQNYLKSGNALVEEALRLKNSVTGSVHIAAYNNVIRDWLPSILQQFHQKYPNIKVSIRQANDMQIKHWMESGEIDLAIVFNSYYNAASFIPLHRTPMVCFTPKDYAPRNGVSMTSEDPGTCPLFCGLGILTKKATPSCPQRGSPLILFFESTMMNPVTSISGRGSAFGSPPPLPIHQTVVSMSIRLKTHLSEPSD